MKHCWHWTGSGRVEVWQDNGWAERRQEYCCNCGESRMGTYKKPPVDSTEKKHGGWRMRVIV